MAAVKAILKSLSSYDAALIACSSVATLSMTASLEPHEDLPETEDDESDDSGGEDAPKA